MSINPYVGWGVTTLLSMFLNKNSSSESASSDPSKLSAEAAELGTPVPLVIGRQLIKQPLTIYYGDFSAKPYTETYSAHANFSAWPLILSALAMWGSALISGKNATPHVHVVTTTAGGGKTTATTPDPIPTKEIIGPQIIMLFANWLLNWLINGRNLKTTMQKGFKYYLGYQMLCCVSGKDIRLRGLYIGYDANSDSSNNGAVWTGNVSREDHLTSPYVINVDKPDLFGGADEGGGFIGDIKVYLGGPNQPADSWMINQMSEVANAHILKVVCVGDSLVAGYPYTNNSPAESADLFGFTNIIRVNSGLKVINKGRGGETTEAILLRFDADVIANKPDYCIIDGGINDLTHLTKLPIIQANFQLMVKKCIDNGIRPYIIIPPPVELNHDPVLTKSTDELRKWLISWCNTATIRTIDFYTILYNGGAIRTDLLSDWIHPNAEGYKQLGQIAYNVLREDGFVNLSGLTPAYRPFVSIVVPTAYIGKQAQIPNTYIDVQWIPNRLGLGGIGDNDANPAEVIYELHVNKEWGLGRDENELNIDSLIFVGTALKNEGHGVSIKITNRTEAKELIDNLCAHLDMVRYVDPSTGKLTFKLIRDDYDPNNLPVINSSIASSIDFTRTVWGSSKGEIIAKYSDSSALYSTSTVMENDPAIIEANGGDRNSEDMDFTYFTTSSNAVWAANRELRQQGFPLASAKLTCNRKAHAYRPGDVFKLNWEPYGISNLVMRVSDVNLGDFISGEITIEAIEDVFGVGKTSYGANDTTSWNPPIIYPTGVQLFKYFEAPWEINNSKDSYVYALATQPDLLTSKWSIWREKDLSWVNTNSMIKWTPTALLVSNLPANGDVEDVVGFEIVNKGGVLELAMRNTESGLAQARNGSRVISVNGELMSWGTITQLANGNFKLSNVIRGTYDTVPANHSSGDIIFFLDNSHYANVTTGGPVCAEGLIASERYNITTATAYAEEPFSNVKITPLATNRRSERPTCPGRIRLSTHMQQNKRFISKAVGDINVAWANRNKFYSNGCVSQDDITDYYTGQEATAPNGLQTVIRQYYGSTLISEKVIDQVLSPYALPVTPTTDNLTWADRCINKPEFEENTVIEILTSLNGLESYQLHSREFSWKPPYIVDACETVEQAEDIMKLICTASGAEVKFSDSTLNKTISFEDMPLIVLGTAYNKVKEGAVLAQNGTYIVPNGTILALISATDYSVVTLENGYIALSYLNDYALAQLVAYQYDGTEFKKIAVPKF